jgi:itaconate CoA-transferase
MNPLEGLTVVALEQAVAAPFATRQLADLGARVIKIERPGAGDFARDYDHAVHGQASYFVWLNRGKESVALDIKRPEDRDVLNALIERADIFVQNLAPGAVARLGLDTETLRQKYPRLITCAISGYGTTGPYRSKKAYDLLVQCEAGLMSITGTVDEAVKVSISIADISAGMYAFSGILTALYERERTGKGSDIEVAMLDALGEWVSQPTTFSMYGDHPSQRSGARHASIAPYGPYRTGDGETVYIGVQHNREWASMCNEVLQQPELATDPRFVNNTDRVLHNDELTSLIENALADMTLDDAVALLDQAGIASARLRTPKQFADHPQLAARDRWRTVQTPAGPIQALLPPVIVAGREALMGDVPALGAHTEQIRAELGLAQETNVPQGN